METNKPNTQPTAAGSDQSHTPFGFTRERVSINKAVYEKQSEILSTAYDFISLKTSPVRAINTLLSSWLDKGFTQSPYFNIEYAQSLLELTSFLYDLKSQFSELDFCEEEVAQDAKKEVNNGQ